MWEIEYADPQPAQEALRQMLDEAYERGRRDALRGVQGACLFEMGRLEERQRKYGGASWDWERCPEDMRAYDVLCEVAEFAEEAAR